MSLQEEKQHKVTEAPEIKKNVDKKKRYGIKGCIYRNLRRYQINPFFRGNKEGKKGLGTKEEEKVEDEFFHRIRWMICQDKL